MNNFLCISIRCQHWYSVFLVSHCRKPRTDWRRKMLYLSVTYALHTSGLVTNHTVCIKQETIIWNKSSKRVFRCHCLVWFKRFFPRFAICAPLSRRFHSLFPYHFPRRDSFGPLLLSIHPVNLLLSRNKLITCFFTFISLRMNWFGKILFPIKRTGRISFL